MRIGLGVAAVLVLLLVIGLAAVSVIIDRRATEAIQEHVASALGVPASLDRASVSLLTGGLGLSGLRVANPPGFEAPEVISMGRGDGRVRLTTFFNEVVEIPELSLTDMEIRLERRDGRGNYESIVTHYLREGRHVGDPDRRYVIDELVVEDALVHLDLLPDVGDAAQLVVPIELRLTGVGEEEAGLMLQEVVGVAVQAIFEAALARAAEELPGAVLQELRGRLRDFLEAEGPPFDPP